VTSTAETIRIALTALMVGIAIPLLAQLFLVLRGVRRTVGVLEQRLDGTLRDLGEVVADLKRVTAPPPASASPALTFASQLVMARWTSRQNTDSASPSEPALANA